jgi:hypothetical protein
MAVHFATCMESGMAEAAAVWQKLLQRDSGCCCMTEAAQASSTHDTASASIGIYATAIVQLAVASRMTPRAPVTLGTSHTRCHTRWHTVQTCCSVTEEPLACLGTSDYGSLPWWPPVSIQDNCEIQLVVQCALSYSCA